MSTGERGASGGTFALLAAAIVILGVNWPLNKMALRSASPLWFTVLRMGGAAAVVGAANIATGRLRPPPRQDWPIVVSVGLVRIAGVAGLTFVALQFVPAGRSSVLVWTASLWTVPIAAVVLHERMSWLRWGGLAIGIGGIVLLFEPWRMMWSNHDVILGHGLLVLAAVLNAAASVHIRRHRWRTGPLEALPWQLLVATGALLVGAVVSEGAPAVRWSWPFGANLAFQTVMASGFALWAQQIVLQRLRATTTTLIMMAVPVVGLISSILVLGESVTAVGVVGVAGILAGVAASVAADTRGFVAGAP